MTSSRKSLKNMEKVCQWGFGQLGNEGCKHTR